MQERYVKGTVVRYTSKEEEGQEHKIVKVHEFDQDTFGYGKYLYIMENGDQRYPWEFEIVSRPTFETIVISAYPCCGKSYAYNHYQDMISILDSDSSNFSWIKDKFGFNAKTRNPDFPKNYIQYIKDNIGKVEVIFVSSHLAVRQALEDAKIKFYTVYPKEDLLNEWVGRMYRRGNKKEFIDFQVNNWDTFMKNVENEPTGMELIRLESNEYIDLEKLMKLKNK